MAEWTQDSPDPDVQLVHTWLLGAGDINRGIGPFAALVKAYNQRQGELRGQPVTDEANQEASNFIARLVISDTISKGAIPDFTDIVRFDAEGGKYLYADHPDDGDTAKLNAANWTGTFLISPFGQDETDRLIQSGISDVQMDTIDDLKNVLFASNAFKEAVWSAPDYRGLWNALAAMYELCDRGQV
jgi:hypothetical protein